MKKLNKAELADIVEDYENITVTQMCREQSEDSQALNTEQKAQVKNEVTRLKARDKAVKEQMREISKQIKATAKEYKMDRDSVMDMLDEMMG